jgi:diaminohydroxyphosphoribosylaminopyrimidine deaminase/5-amino-6-(5-phosphoribosylamino)uracil reductase
MRRALEQARRGLGRTTPNPIVGACVVSDEGVVLGQGAHEFAGGPHAEINALDEAGADARGATLYCTLEPCSHTGRTGRVLSASSLQVSVASSPRCRIPFLMSTAWPCRAPGARHPRGCRCRTRCGGSTESAVPHYVREGRPFVILKAATSLDGRIAVEGERTTLSSLGALRHAQYMRASVDAIGVGSQTVLIDDPLLTAREVYRRARSRG